MIKGYRTTLSDGYLEQKFVSPSGDAILTQGNSDMRKRERDKANTKFMNMMRSSGTPCSISTSTAFIAEPPVAVYNMKLTQLVMGHA